MPVQIEKAMVLAAGRGTRMRSLTDETPKPLIKVKERPLIDRIVDKIVAYGITQGVVNVCYLGDMIKADLSKRTDISLTFSEEETALETGGGVKKALPLLGEKPFFVVFVGIFTGYADYKLSCIGFGSVKTVLYDAEVVFRYDIRSIYVPVKREFHRSA